ncbi:MAG: hypothetical protein COA73_13565 [Candidatus Hydrogenedentota bacterium]|nr:MAG: hypothetical protein COA73_13565 [Candidatus Hydrogenedentota bacterium]
MDRRQIATKLTLDLAEIELNLENFQKRLILQKSIYLLQKAGVKLGYSYSWYLRGPYSRGLTSDAFDMKDEINTKYDDSVGWNLDDNSCSVIKNIQPLLTSAPDGFPSESTTSEDQDFELANWLELLASAHFLIDTSQVGKDNIEDIRIKLESFDKEYNDVQICTALSSLKSYSLLS